MKGDSDPRLQKALASDILEAARKAGAKLKKAGANEYAGPCPACGGTDRFSINTKDKVFNCRGASGGSIISMARHALGLDFDGALEWLTGDKRVVRSNKLSKSDRNLREDAESDDGRDFAPIGADPDALSEQSRDSLKESLQGDAEAPAAPSLKDREEALERAALRAPWAACYDYKDEMGVLISQKIRWEWKGVDGGKRKTFRQRRPARASDDPAKVRDGFVWTRTGFDRVPYRLVELQAALAEGETVYLCYSPDTDILTDSGWVSFPHLTQEMRVAAWDMQTESISFENPSAIQKMTYSGEMLNIKSDAIDLLVTPDHRQPVDYETTEKKYPLRVITADKIRQQHRIPTSGIYTSKDPAGPSSNAARLLVAWYADGSWQRAGAQVHFNLKKRRKIERLRELLATNGIKWREHSFPSCPEWTLISLQKTDLAQAVGAGWEPSGDKRWPIESMHWPLKSRESALEEMRFWDGDAVGVACQRLFTGEKATADAVSAIAAVSGWYSAIRVDRREGRNDSYVVNMAPKRRKQMSRAPTRLIYSGDIHCCTVSTGFIVVRRNGKVGVSGNCEGEKKADLLWEWGLAATCTDQGAGQWAPELNQYFRGADVVILPDNDPQQIDKSGRPRFHKDGRPVIPGRDHAQAVGRALRPYAKAVRVLEIPGLPPKGDIVDFAEAGGTAERLVDLTRETAKPWAPDRPGSKFGAMLWSELDKPGAEIEWLIDDFITVGDRSILGGESQSGKTFLALHMAMCVATGQDFFDHKVRQGLVVYQAGESAKGAKKRMRAWRRHFNIDPAASLPIVLLTQKIDLFGDPDAAQNVIDEIKGWEAYFPDDPLRLFVIDTLAKASLGAEENSAKEMGIVLDNAERIEAETGAHVMAVHHMNAQGKKLRGSTAIRANIDQVAFVSVNLETKVRTLSVEKQKEDEEAEPLQFELMQVRLGERPDGKPITSCIVLPPGEKEEIRKIRRDGFFVRAGVEDLAFRSLLKALSDHGVLAGPDVQVALGTRIVHAKKWFAEYRRIAPYENDDERVRLDSARRALKKAQGSFIKYGLIGQDGDFVWHTGKPVRGFPETFPPADRQSNVVPFRGAVDSEGMDIGDFIG